MRSDPAGLVRWLRRELDADGLPRRLPVLSWWPVLAGLAAACRLHPSAWPAELDELAALLFRSALRFSRPDGSAVFSNQGDDRKERAALLRFWADRLGDPALARVVDWWFPRRRPRPGDPAPPPLPAVASDHRPLAMLRPDWTARGDLLAVDERGPGQPDWLELIGDGGRLLGDAWHPAPGPRRSRPERWMSGPTADLAEWAFASRGLRIVRTAVLLRGRGLALLADLVRGNAPEAEMRLGLGDLPATTPLPDSHGRSARAGRGAPVQFLPIGLGEAETDRSAGTLIDPGGELRLRQPLTGGRAWLPLVVCWDRPLARKPALWRRLTVTERSAICRPQVAFAARVGWPGSEGLVVYRSLGRPALRAFLGHQTSARLLIGRFTRDGKVEPLVSYD